MISLSAVYFLKCQSCITYYISIAYLCKTPNETRCLPGTLEALRADGVQIVILDSPEIYSEYAPGAVKIYAQNCLQAPAE